MKNTSKEAYFERLRNLADVNNTSLKETQSRTLGTLIDYKRAADGVAYGIIKENHNYFLKKGGMKKDPDVSDFAYIGGLGNITNFQYKSLSEADKNRNMILHTINESITTKVNPNGSKKLLNEDIAGQEIDNAENMLGDLDSATAAAKQDDGGEAEMAAGLTAEPSAEMADAGAEMADTGAEMADTGAADAEMGDADAEMGDADAEMADAGAADAEMADAGAETGNADALAIEEPVKELEKGIGKLTNKIRKIDLEPEVTKSFLKSLIQAFKDKLPELEIEERKEIANLLLKIVPPEDVENLSDAMPPEETEDDLNEKQGCSECGTFAQYAESMGYNSAESLMECGEEGVANLISNYANHAADGQNDGDAENVALVIKIINPEMLNTLKQDYGHEEYSDKLTPYVDSMNESSDEDNITKLNELFGGLKSLAQGAGRGISGAVKGVGNAIGGAAQQVGQAVKTGAQQAGQAVAGAAQNVAQTYHGGEVAGEVKKLERLANDLGAQVAALNTRLVKAGQTPVDAQKIIAAVSNQIRAGKGASVAGTTAGAGIREDNDPAYTQTQPLMEDDDLEGIEATEPEATEPEKINFGGAQTLGGGVVKPDGAPTTISVESSNGTTVEVNLNEVMKKLKQVVAESKPSAGLSKEKKSEVVKKAKAGEDIGKKGKGFEKVAAKAAKEYGSKEAGEKVAAAAMWKNLKKEGVEAEAEVMTESEKKIRAYVRKRLEEHAGLRKPSLNESKKSPTLKRLDEMIDTQYKSFGDVVKKTHKKNINELFGFGDKNTESSKQGEIINKIKEMTQQMIDSNPEEVVFAGGSPESQIQLLTKAAQDNKFRGQITFKQSPRDQKWYLQYIPEKSTFGKAISPMAAGTTVMGAF
jgi:hypothetical protein